VCEPACGLVARVEDGRLVQLRPDREHPVTRGFACHKGLAGLDLHHDEDRLGWPLARRADGSFERIGWDDAIGQIAARLRGILDRHGPQAIGSYMGNPTAFNSLVAPAAAAFFSQLGARRAFSSGTQDCANKFAGSEAVFGSSTIHPIPDLEHTEYLLVIGENPRVSHMSFLAIADPMRVLRAARRRGARIRFVNPRRIESAVADVGDVVQIRPDTDVYFLAALLCEIERSVGFDARAIEAHGRNVEGLREFVRRYPPERVADVVGVPAETIREIAREFAAAPSASVHASTGLNMGRQGTLAYWLVHMLAFVTGNLDRRGGNVLSVGFYPNARAGRRPYEQGFADTRWGKLRRGTLPGNLLPDAIEDAEQPLRALFVVAGNPLLSIGGEERMRQAFAKLELLVVIDLYRSATGELAHYALPATDMFERADLNITGLGLQHRPYVQWSERVVEPKDERREEWWIFARLCRALGLEPPCDESDEASVFSRLDHMLGKSGLSVEELRRHPHGVVLPAHEPGRFFAEHLQTSDRRVDCCPTAFAEAIGRAEAEFREREQEPEGTLRLIIGRDPYMHNSWYHNVEKLKRGDRDTNRLHLHPDDARARGLVDGAKARVWNRWGALDVQVRTSDELRPGVVFLVHGWGNARTPGMRTAQRSPGVNSNVLLPSGPGSFDPLSNQAHMTGIPVEVAAL
jgi:anaerobic selenocysteine-containing dehydrogenase